MSLLAGEAGGRRFVEGIGGAGDVPAFEPNQKRGGTQLERWDFAGTTGDLPEPGDHVFLGLRHEEVGGSEALFEVVEARQAGAEVVGASSDLGFFTEGLGAGFAVFVVEAGIGVSVFRGEAGGEAEGE
jgi:hypothetical protein